MGSIFHIHYYSTHFLIVFLFIVLGSPCVLNLHFQLPDIDFFYCLLHLCNQLAFITFTFIY